MKPVIEVKGLGKSYVINHKDRASYSTIKDDFTNLVTSPFAKHESKEEKFWALKDINFEVKQGEIFGVIGRNGSGKSTLLKILSRIVQPTEGHIKLNGRVASLLEVGTGFHPELTGRENVYFNGSMLGMSRKEIDAKFDEIVEFSEIEKFIDTPVKFYSSGMYVRLAFAVAAHLDPDILILDEVLAVGDASFQQKSLKKIQGTINGGSTVLFVSHSMSSIRQLCSSGLMLDKGRIAISGSVDDIIENYTLENEKYRTQKSSREIGFWWKNETFTPDDTTPFVPSEVYVTSEDDNKKLSGPLSNGKDYLLHIKGYLNTNDEQFNVGYSVWDEDLRQMMYMSFTTDQPKGKWVKPELGLVEYIAKIPKNSLNEGRYIIKIVASIYSKEWVLDPDSSQVKLAIQVRHADQLSPFWKDNRGGLFSPLIEWSIRK